MTDEEAERQETHRNRIGQLSVSLVVGQKDGGFFTAYATTVGREPRLETTVSNSYAKNRAISYALTELATMFDREGK